MPIPTRRQFLQVAATASTIPLLARSIHAASASPTRYYISPAGDDASAGTSPDVAWRTIARVNAQRLRPGDQVLFEGGKTFAGTIRLDAEDAGEEGRPVVIGSYGEGQASIQAGDEAHGLWARGTNHLRVANLNFTGAGRTTLNNGRGIFLEELQHAEVDQIDASGFQKAGVEARGCTHVRVTNVHAFENGFAGIFAHRNCSHIYVGHCRAINNPGDPAITRNHSGNGILFYGTTDSMIEFCEAARNGWDQPKGPPNGPVGIWCATSSRIVIQYCISHHNRSTSGDGGGFDLDGGTQDSIIQFCYSHDNHSSGYLMWEYGSKAGIKRNTVRYCISENDREGGVRFGTSGPGGVDEIDIYNNVVINMAHPAVEQHGGDLSNIRFRNNIFITKAGVDCVHTHKAFTYQGNCYWRTDGSFKAGGHASLQAWSDATGQEKLDGRLVGLHADPKLIDPIPSKKPTDPRDLPKFIAYMLGEGSPCIGAGLDLKARFGIDPGKTNFAGQPLPTDGKFNMGIQ